MKQERHAPIPQRKVLAVEEITLLAKQKKTMLVASIKNLPSSQFQEIGKKLRGRAVVKVPKKNLLVRALKETKIPELAKAADHLVSDVAVLFSDIDSFDLALELIKSKSPVKAKPGQIAPNDIEVQPGPTDLVPGPAISELGALGIKIQIQGGKIEIKEPKVIIKAGEKITQAACDVMSKLNIRPFTIGFTPLFAFDMATRKIYTEIAIDRDATLAELKDAYARALPFAVSLGYTVPETIALLLQKAERQALALSTHAPNEQNGGGN